MNKSKISKNRIRRSFGVRLWNAVCQVSEVVVELLCRCISGMPVNLRKVAVFAAGIFIGVTITAGIAFAGDVSLAKPLYTYYDTVEIKTGDTLWSIASDLYENNGYTDVRDYVKVLEEINSLHNGEYLIPGKQLVITYRSSEYK